VRVLTVVEQPAAPGTAVATATLTLRSGGEHWMCNPMPELVEAMDAGVPFTGHAVKSMRPVELVVNPAHVATIQAHEPA